MKRCPECNRFVDDNAQCCPNCGYELRQPKCGYELSQNESFNVKLSGVTFEGRQPRIARLHIGDPLTIRPIYDNPYDTNCVEVFNSSGESVGFIPKGQNVEFRNAFRNGYTYDAVVENISGGGYNYSYGLTITVTKKRLT